MPMLDDRRIDLVSETDAHGTRRFVTLVVARDGTLTLEGQDLGGGLAGFFGGQASEYEWLWKLTPEQAGRLLRSLGIPDAAPDRVEQLVSHLRSLSTATMQEQFKASGATFSSHVSD